MTLLSELRPKYGSKHRRKRIGFGEGSGHGGSATKGMKGQRSRAGDGKLVGFEGGQTPLLRRVPKRGFNNKVFARRFQIINTGVLEAAFENGASIDPEVLEKAGFLRRTGPVKILGDGRIQKKLSVAAHAFSANAKASIEGAGGTVTLIQEQKKPSEKS